MVFWNNDLKRWQKQGGGVEPGTNAIALGDGSGLATDFSSPIAWMFNNGLCGFGPMGPIMTGSSTTKTTHEFIDPAVLGAYVRPVEQWGFPFSARYHMTSSNIVKARDLGIHQPFLFEKAVLDFGAVFEFPEASFPSKAYSHRYTYGTDDSPAVTTQAGFQQVVPTFFMLRQMPGQRRHMQTIYVDRTPGAAITPAGGGSYQVDGWDPVPNTKKVGHGARGLPYGNRWSHETRELITYGQLVIAQSGSHGYSQFTTEDFMNNIGRDGGGFYNFADSEIDYTLTGSFRIEFPCRTTAKYPAGTVGVKLYGNTIGTSVGGSGVANKYMARLGNETYGGRATGNSGDFTSGRSLVNGLAPITPAGDGSEEVAIHGPVAAEKFIHFQKVKAESYDQASPYIILPDDDLILGWQYPLSFNLTQEPGSDSVKVNRMALSGSAKLHLYGSNILMNKETTTNSLNQLLTSDAVHEIIGAEPIYDRFYVEGRDAYTGSYVDQLLAADAAKDAVGRLNDVLLQTRPDGSGNIGDVIVGVQSIVGYDPYETHQTNRSLTGSFQRHVTLTDGTRVYYDSQFSNGHFYGAGYVAERPNFRYDQFKLPHDPSETLDTDNTVDDGGEYDAAVPYTGSRGHKMWQDSSYGTMQTTSAGSSSPNTWRPKYNFSMNHFGHYADMIKQARDSKTVSIFTGGGIAGWLSRRRPQAKQTIESPVQVRFVSGGLVDDARLKCYYMDSRPPNMFYTTASSETGLDQVIYTKGNMSQESTASFGWSESGTGASVNTPFYFNWFDIATMTPGAYAVSTVVSNLAAWGSTSPTVVTRQFDL
jgi:hypothetical protein